MHRLTHHAPAHHLSIREAARQLGFVHTTISRYVRRFPELNRGSKGRPAVDLDELRRHREANVNPFRIGSHAGRLFGENSGGGKGNKNGAGQAYAVSKAAREAILADRAQIDLDEKRGLLVPRAEVEDAVFESGLLLQRNLLHLCSQVAERLASMSVAREITEVLEGEVRKVLAELAASLRAKAEEEAKARPPPR